MANKCVKLFIAVLKPFLILILGIALLPLIPNLPPDLKYTPFTAPEPPALTGKLAVNRLLDGAKRLFEGEIIGPEGFAIHNGELYTTLHGGFVAKVTGGKIEPVVKFGQPCEERYEEAKCGRPLGIFSGPDNLLYISDAYYGVFTYDVNKKKSTKLFGHDDVIAGRKPRLPNSLTVANDGTIYWTDSSSDVLLQDGLYSMLADGTGRLIKYDQNTKKHTVLMDGLLFANGVAVAPDESFVLVAETGMARVHRYWLKGAQAGRSEIFADRLPGLPDNLRAGSDGFLVSLILATDDATPILAQSLFPFPYIRKAVSRAAALIELAFEKIDSFYPHPFFKKAVHFIGHFEMTKPLSPLRVSLLVFDTNGELRESFYALDGSVTSISDAIVYRGELFLGSPYNPYLGSIRKTDVVARFQKAFPQNLQTTIRVKPSTTTTTPRPTTTTPPATTTTPRPTTTTPPPTTTTPRPATTTPKPATTTQKPASTTPKPTTTKPKATTTTPKPTTTTPRPTTTKATPTTASPPTTNIPKKRENNEL